MALIDVLMRFDHMRMVSAINIEYMVLCEQTVVDIDWAKFEMKCSESLGLCW